MKIFTSFVLMHSALLLVPSAQAELIVYTDRLPSLMSEAKDTFQAETNEPVTFVEMKAQDIVKKMEESPADFPADAVILNDLVWASQLASSNKLLPLSANPAWNQVPAFMRDPDNRWIGLTYRVRTAVVSNDPSRVSAEEIASLKTYQDVAADRWAGRLCLRSSSSKYNVALAGFLIGDLGLDLAKSLLAGWIQNLAQSVFNSDEKILDAIVGGDCDIGIVNHYYFNRVQHAQTLAGQPALPLNLVWLNQDSSGAHSNGTIVALTATTHKAQLGEKFIEILLRPGPQKQLADGMFVFSTTAQPTVVLSPQPWSEIGLKQSEVLPVFDSVGYP